MNFLEDDHGLGPQPCPWCNEPNDVSVYLGGDGDKKPQPGDFAICFSCATPSVFQEVGKPRAPTESEWAKLNADDNITKTRREIFMINLRDKHVDFRTGGVSYPEDEA